jgi:NAD(P)-dependent dehydrogenase (short-subunit alcohol dehydrogenase family)
MLATAGLAYAYASKNVRVVGLNPGVTQTERVAEGLKAEAKRANVSEEQAYKQMVARLPMGRPAKPEEIADIAVFAASERGRYLNGANISTDGAASHVIV